MNTSKVKSTAFLPKGCSRTEQAAVRPPLPPRSPPCRSFLPPQQDAPRCPHGRGCERGQSNPSSSLVEARYHHRLVQCPFFRCLFPGDRCRRLGSQPQRSEGGLVYRRGRKSRFPMNPSHCKRIHVAKTGVIRGNDERGGNVGGCAALYGISFAVCFRCGCCIQVSPPSTVFFCSCRAGLGASCHG